MTDRIHDRIHDCLDGDLPRVSLTEEEARQLDELEALVHKSLAFVREASPPDVTSDVMARIAPAAAEEDRRAPVRRIRDALAWVWTPRAVQIRPAWALAVLVFFVLGGALLMRPGVFPGAGERAATVEEDAATGPELASDPADATGGEPQETTLYVRFDLNAADAASVALAGSFTDWQPRYRLAETAPGRWTALIPLPPGVHDYSFVVNGERWVPDPDAMLVDDGFGGVNSRISLLDPEI